MLKDRKTQGVMKRFWNTKAADHPFFYIATWRGYGHRDLNGFFLTQEEADQFLQEAMYRPTGRDRMLEIGCGVGRMTHGFAPLFGELHAIDVSGEMIKLAEQYLAAFDNVYLYETNGTDLQIFQDNFFEFCFSFLVFQHIPSKSIIFSYIREVARVLKPGGKFHFQVNGLPDLDAKVPVAILAVKRVYRHFIRRPVLLMWHCLRGGPGGFESPAWMGVRVTADKIQEVCRDSGFTVCKVVGEGTQYMWITAKKH